MKCRQAGKIIKRQVYSGNSALDHRTRQHLAACADCRHELKLDRLALSLLQARATPTEETLPPYFFARLRARINAEQAEPSFWDAAVATARGWLLAFGSLTAILLAAFIFTWRAQTPAPEFDNAALMLPVRTENIVIANSEPLQDEVVLSIFGAEDYAHARK
jgi:hypothetical protein